MSIIQVSTLNHTWFIDLDGTILKHNGHLSEGDCLLTGVKEFWKQIPSGDIIVILSARLESEKDNSLAYLTQHGLRYNYAIFNLPTGERILINDMKPSGLKTAIALNIARDEGIQNHVIEINHEI
jgi:hypothetical protein